MTIKRISFEEVRYLIVKSIGLEVAPKHLTPDDISDAFAASNVKLDWFQLEWWEQFEAGELDVNYDSFIRELLITKQFSEDIQVIIITDDCFKDYEAFLLSLCDLTKFIDELYPNTYKRNFFQPEDLIMFMPNEQQISILHHSGYIAQYPLK